MSYLYLTCLNLFADQLVLLDHLGSTLRDNPKLIMESVVNGDETKQGLDFESILLLNLTQAVNWNILW